jgi:hypothetical protein
MPYNLRLQHSPSSGNLEGQTQLCYDWETQRFTFRDESIITLKQCRSLVKEVWKALKLKTKCPIIVDGRGSIYARATGNIVPEIHLPRWSRNNIIVLHELAHHICDMIDPVDSAQHGGIFMHVELTLLSRFAGYKYRELAQSAINYGLAVKNVKLAVKLKTYMTD